MTTTLILLYFFIGSLLVHGRLEDIANDVPNPGDIASVTATLLKWTFTWPMWVKR